MSRLRTKKQIKSKENSINQKKTQKSRIKNQSNKKQLKLWWKMLIKTHFIVTMDPFCNIFTLNYHSKSLHDHEHLDFWKGNDRISSIKTVTSKKPACMDPFLSVDTLYFTCTYFTFLFLSVCPEYLWTQKEKVHWSLSQPCVLLLWEDR